MTTDQKRTVVRAPKFFSIGPFFAAKEQDGQRIVEYSSKRFEIGGFDPLDPDHKPPAYDVRHGRMTIALLAIRDENHFGKDVYFSFRDLCSYYAKSRGGRYARDIKKLLSALTRTWVRIIDLETGDAFTVRLLERVYLPERPILRRDHGYLNSRQTDLKLNQISFSAEFYSLLTDIQELQQIRYDEFLSITSPLAQSIYLYMPSRAVHHKDSKPFEITLTNLLEQVSYPLPKAKSKPSDRSAEAHEKKLRRQLFSKKSRQSSRSVIEQLDGRKTLTGTFRAKLAETSDGTDWKLQCWVEKELDKFIAQKEPTSALYKRWRASGKSRAQFQKRLARIRPLDEFEGDGELYSLQCGNVRTKGNERFLEQALAILGNERFHQLASEAKSDFEMKVKPTIDETRRFIHRILEAVHPITG